MIIPIVSSEEIDNVKYERDVTFNGILVEDNVLLEEYKPIEIVNMLGAGDILFEGYIYQHDNICGEECSSYMNVSLLNDGSLIDDIIFKTLQEDGSWVEQDVRNYKIEYYTLLNKSECVFGEAPRCYFTDETEMGWKRYFLGQSVEAGVHEVRIEANKRADRSVDWVIKTNGEWLDSWATWGSIVNGSQAEVLLLSPEDNSVGSNFTFECSANVTGGSSLKNISFWNDIGGVFQPDEVMNFNDIEVSDWALVGGWNIWMGTFYNMGENWTYILPNPQDYGSAGGWVNLSSGVYSGTDISDRRQDEGVEDLEYFFNLNGEQLIFTHNVTALVPSITMRYADWHLSSGLSAWIEWLNETGGVLHSEQFVNEVSGEYPMSSWEVVTSYRPEGATQVRIRVSAVGWQVGLLVDYIDIGGVFQINEAVTFSGASDTTDWTLVGGQSDWEGTFYPMQPNWTYSRVYDGYSAHAGGWVNLSSGDFYGQNLSDTRQDGSLAYIFWSNGGYSEQMFTHNVTEADTSITMRFTDWHYFSGMSAWVEWLNSTGGVVYSEQFVDEVNSQQPTDYWQVLTFENPITDVTQVRVRIQNHGEGYGTGLVVDYIDIGENTYGSTQTFSATINDITTWNCQACDSDDECGFAVSDYVLHFPNIVVIPEESSAVNLYNVMESSGAGLGVLLSYMVVVLPVFFIGLSIFVIIYSIGYAIVKAFPNIKTMGKR